MDGEGERQRAAEKTNGHTDGQAEGHVNEQTDNRLRNADLSTRTHDRLAAFAGN